MLFLQSVAVFIYNLVTLSAGTRYENIFGDRYGKDWILQTDEEGTSHFVDLTVPPEQSNDSSRYERNVYFYLYTRENINETEELEIENGIVNSTYFSPNNQLKVITHGWLSNGFTQWILDIKDTYLKTENLNVISVDWNSYASNVYSASAYDTTKVGKKVADLLDAINKSYGLGGEDMHLIGHSLGAHVMGYAGSLHRVSRITGLDPARPWFEAPPATDSRRLDKSDAEFVDIIHTCGGVLGYRSSHGHADFYPNGGQPAQPGCEGWQQMLEGCSHGRAYVFYRESIETEKGFYSYPCESYEKFQTGDCKSDPVLMGAHLGNSSSGDYYLYTNGRARICTRKNILTTPLIHIRRL